MNFLCPYCNHTTTITEPNKHNHWAKVDIDAKYLNYDHELGVGFLAIVCPNKDCKELTLVTRLTGASGSHNPITGRRVVIENVTTLRAEWPLLPESDAKPQPSYIPKAIVQDYTEACRIKYLSPKASATLARRCLQGMIRDFHGISKGTLNDEITALKGTIPNDEWSALDALRSIGNIGAHMEKDVNLIIDVTPDEAEKLIAFIEYLFKQWYIKRHDDQENLASIQAIAGIKKTQKQDLVIKRPTAS